MRRLIPVLFVLLPAAFACAQTVQPRVGDPLPGLTPEQRALFFDGRIAFGSLFEDFEGLGPAFNGASCSACHNVPLTGGSSIQIVDRVGAILPDGTYSDIVEFGGPVLQNTGIQKGCYETYPTQATAFTVRRTPALFGLGLIEAIDDQTILAFEAAQSGGISGRANRAQALEDGPNGPIRVGRFSFKAAVPSVLQFSADAAINEMGMTNRLFPNETAPNGNLEQLEMCDLVPDPEDIEDANGRGFIDRITDYQRYLAAPPQTPRSGMEGEALFVEVGCASCHIPSYTTSNNPALEDALRGVTIKPYSDFLVHDMGDTGEFQIEQGLAVGGEMRTTPLWGLRWNVNLWHDGRVGGNSLGELILDPVFGAVEMHAAPGSEARPSALLFQAMPEVLQLEVVRFLDSLGRREFDANDSNTITIADLNNMAGCFTGPGVFYTADDPCAIHDLDQDGDVDLDDLAGFVLVLSSAQPDCDNDGTGNLDAILAGAIDINLDLIPDSCQILAPCPGDCDDSGTVDFNDLICILFEFGNPPGPGSSPTNCDNSTEIDFNDLICALFNFGAC